MCYPQALWRGALCVCVCACAPLCLTLCDPSPCEEVLCECVRAQSCLTLSDSMDCSPPGSSVHGILQARTLEWVAVLERNKINTRERVRKRDPSGVSNRVSWPSAHNNLVWSVSEQRNSSVCVREHTCTAEQCFPNFSMPTNHSGLWWSGQWLMRSCIASSLQVILWLLVWATLFQRFWCMRQ